jgi:hypothetical protein
MSSQLLHYGAFQRSHNGYDGKLLRSPAYIMDNSLATGFTQEHWRYQRSMSVIIDYLQIPGTEQAATAVPIWCLMSVAPSATGYFETSSIPGKLRAGRTDELALRVIPGKRLETQLILNGLIYGHFLPSGLVLKPAALSE